MRIVKWLCAGLAVCVAALLVLFYLFEMRFESDGSGRWPLVHFGKKESHYAELERNRAEQLKHPAPLAAPAPPAAEAAAAAPVPAAIPTVTAYWTGFRGPNRDGSYDQTRILTEWPRAGLKPLWKQPVGGGYSSFVIAGGRAYTIEQRRDQEAVTAYDIRTGRELWAHTYPADFREAMGGDGPRATPAWNDGLLYSLGATGEFRCLDAATGAVRWQKNILEDAGARNINWGMAASPLVVDDKVIVQPGGSPGRSIVAYNRLTGARVWQSLDDTQAYTSPMLVTLAGRRQIVTVTARRVVGITVEDGTLLWDYPWVTEYDVNSAQPIIVDSNHVLISAGYGHGAALLNITQRGGKLNAEQVWANTRMKNRFASSVLHGGHIYGFDEAIMACVDARTGDLKWKGGRYGYGQLLIAGERLIVITESGDLVLVKATPERHEELAKFSAISGKTWNVPALDDGYLLVRNATQMACFRVAR